MKKLKANLKQVREILVKNNNDFFVKEIDILDKRLNDDTFRITVVGEFSSGKSTFINAIIGCDVLSHAVNETTATITHIRNVMEDDKRLNTCEIFYNDGHKTELSDLTQLSSFTTVQSNNNVADSIAYVVVYCHINGINHDIDIIDTPGLNGIADKHREITLNEVKKSHACIYVLSDKGLKLSDCDTLNLLKKYQDKFIFVQNYADKFNMSEGETINTKIESNIKAISEQFGENSFKNMKICGISALYALCGKDNSIKKLYNDSVFEITSEERQELWKKSGFEQFEGIIRDMINSGEYKKVIIRSGMNALANIISDALVGLNGQQELNQLMQSKDNRNDRIKIAKKAIKYIESRRNVQQKQLENFLISCDNENQCGLREKNKQMLANILKNIYNEIDDNIKSYEDYQNFELFRQTKVNVYFSKFAMQQIEKMVNNDINEAINNNFSHMYEEAVQRIEEYNIQISEKAVFAINLSNIEEKMDIKTQNALDKLVEYKQDVKEARTEMNKISDDMLHTRENINRIENDKKRSESDIYSLSGKKRNEISNLGSRPQITKKQEARQRKIQRNIFQKAWNGLKSLFGKGESDYETYYVTVDDPASIRRQEDYDRKKRFIENKYLDEEARIQSKISAYENNIRKLKTSNEKAKARIERNQEVIKDLEERIKKQTDIYEKSKRSFQKEFCETLKRNLKNDLKESFFDNMDSLSIELQINQHIKKMSEKNLPVLKNDVLSLHETGIKNQLASLNKVISADEETMEKEYHILDADINKLNKIFDELEKEIS